MDRILLTGAAGYLGGCVARELGRRLIPVTPLSSRLEEIRPQSLDCETVIHCAGALRHRPAEHESANHLGTLALLNGLARPDARILLVSSRGVYSPSEAEMIDESAPVGPADSYGQTKLLAEQAVLSCGRPCLVLRPTTLIGQGVNNAGPSFVATALNRMLAGDEVLLHEPDRDIDFLDVNDLAVMMAELLSTPSAWDQVYNAAAPRRSLHQFLRLLAANVESETNTRVRLRSMPGPPPHAPLLGASRLNAMLINFVYRDDDQTHSEMVRVRTDHPVNRRCRT